MELPVPRAGGGWGCKVRLSLSSLPPCPPFLSSHLSSFNYEDRWNHHSLTPLPSSVPLLPPSPPTERGIREFSKLVFPPSGQGRLLPLIISPIPLSLFPSLPPLPPERGIREFSKLVFSPLGQGRLLPLIAAIDKIITRRRHAGEKGREDEEGREEEVEGSRMMEVEGGGVGREEGEACRTCVQLLVVVVEGWCMAAECGGKAHGLMIVAGEPPFFL